MINNTENTRYSGQVKWFNKKAGYGFITCSTGEMNGKDIFVHYRSLSEGDHYKYLVQGEYVEFAIGKPEKETFEYTAINITGVNGGKIICETRVDQPRRNKSRDGAQVGNDTTAGETEFTKVQRKGRGKRETSNTSASSA